jgi:ribokinase
LVLSTDVNAYLNDCQNRATLHGSSYKIGLGGKGANQAVAARKLGSDVKFICRIGPDIFGDTAFNEIASYGVSTDYILRDPKGATGLAIINVGGDGENAISLIGGSNMTLDETDVARSARALENAKILLLQMEVPFDSSLRAARLAKKGGATVILDPAPAPKKPYAREVYDAVDILTPNEIEQLRWLGNGRSHSRRRAPARPSTWVIKTRSSSLAPGCVREGPSWEGFIPPFKVTPIDQLPHTRSAGQPMRSNKIPLRSRPLRRGLQALSTTKGAAATAPSPVKLLRVNAAHGFCPYEVVVGFLSIDRAAEDAAQGFRFAQRIDDRPRRIVNHDFGGVEGRLLSGRLRGEAVMAESPVHQADLVEAKNLRGFPRHRH